MYRGYTPVSAQTGSKTGRALVKYRAGSTCLVAAVHGFAMVASCESFATWMRRVVRSYCRILQALICWMRAFVWATSPSSVVSVRNLLGLALQANVESLYPDESVSTYRTIRDYLRAGSLAMAN
jgi:hypothetical protein